jgi:hypothetical protein
MLKEVFRNRRRGGHERQVEGGYGPAAWQARPRGCQLPEGAEADSDGSLEWRSFKQLSTLAR